jgi:hypothetical protein
MFLNSHKFHGQSRSNATTFFGGTAILSEGTGYGIVLEFGLFFSLFNNSYYGLDGLQVCGDRVQFGAGQHGGAKRQDGAGLRQL